MSKTVRNAVGAAALIGAVSAGQLAIAHSTPADPMADDYVALAFSPSTGRGGWGTAGTDDGARSIAVVECKHAGGAADCTVAASNQYGCVADAINPQTGHWTGGNGPTPEAAQQDALAHIDGGQLMSTQCSNPMTRP